MAATRSTSKRTRESDGTGNDQSDARSGPGEEVCAGQPVEAGSGHDWRLLPRKHQRCGGSPFERAFFAMDTQWRIAAAFVKLRSRVATVEEVRCVFGEALGARGFDWSWVWCELLDMQHNNSLRFSVCETKLCLYDGAYKAAEAAIQELCNSSSAQ